MRCNLDGILVRSCDHLYIAVSWAPMHTADHGVRTYASYLDRIVPYVALGNRFSLGLSEFSDTRILSKQEWLKLQELPL